MAAYMTPQQLAEATGDYAAIPDAAMARRDARIRDARSRFYAAWLKILAEQQGEIEAAEHDYWNEKRPQRRAA